MNKLKEDTINACNLYGAFTVRKAAIRQMRVDSKALEEVGLADYTKDVTDVSNVAFSLLNSKEKQEDFDLHYSNDDWKKSREYRGKS